MKKKTIGILSLALCAALGTTLAACKEKTPDAPEHTHTYAAEWTITDTHHWHAATCEHTDEKEGYGEHSFGEWTTKTEADYGVDKVEKRNCTACEKQEERTVANSALAAKDNPITVETIAFTYNAKPQPIDELVKADGKEGMVIEYVGTGETEYAKSTTAPKNAGTYQYTITIPATAEWKAAEKTGEYTIEKYELVEVYGKTHTKEYSGALGISVSVNPFGSEEVSVSIAMKKADAGTEEINKVWVSGSMLAKNNYTVNLKDKDGNDNFAAKILPRKLGGFDLKVTAAEVPDGSTGEKTLTFVIDTIIDKDKGKIAVTVTFNAQAIWETSWLDLTTGDLEQGKAVIEFKTDGESEAYLNYELDLSNLGKISLDRK